MRTMAVAAALSALAALLQTGGLGVAAAQEPAAQEPADQETAPAAPGPYEPVRRDPLGLVLVNAPTPYTLGARKLEVSFTHRFREPVNDGDSHDLWGLDSGADTGIGFVWGAASHFDLSLYRASLLEDFEVAGKLLVFEQAPRVPLSIALRAGADLVRQPNVEDASRPFAQLLLSRRIVPGVNVLVAPSWVKDTPRLRNAFNVPVGLTFPLPGKRLIELEYIPKNRDLDDSQEAWHVGFSKALGGHIFEVTVGNSRATTVDQMLGGDSSSGFKRGDVRLGFNLIRDFSF